MDIKQVLHEIDWLKGKVEELKSNSPHKIKQIRTLERNIREKELKITFSDN